MLIASYSLFSHPRSAYNDPNVGEWAGRFFARHLPAVVRAHAHCYPGWRLTIMVDAGFWSQPYCDVVAELDRRGDLEVRVHPQAFAAEHLCGGMLWRMRPVFSGADSMVITRDLDSLPTPREAAMVKEWMESGRPAHAIHDSTSHTGPFMGGMCGYASSMVRAATGIKDFADFMARVHALGLDLNQHGADQVALNLVLGPALAKDMMVHCTPMREVEGVGEVRPEPPAESWSVRLGPALTDREGASAAQVATWLVPHVGAVFNHVAPIEFYDSHFGLSEVRRAAASCEEWCQRARAPQDWHRPPRDDRYVLLSSDANHDYAFFLPIAARLWLKMGYRPLVHLVDGFRSRASPWWPGGAFPEGRKRVVLSWLRAAGAEVYFYAPPDGYLSSTVAQSARLWAGDVAGLFPFQNYDPYILTADADMLPLSASFFAPSEAGDDVTLWYANAYAHEPEPHFPLCYIGARASTWLGLGFTRENALRDLPRADAPEHQQWNHDERWASARIAGANELKIERRDRLGAPPTDRIDRSCWPETIPANAVDCHAPRPGWTDENWRRICEVLAAYFTPDQEMISWLAAYRGAFLNAKDTFAVSEGP